MNDAIEARISIGVFEAEAILLIEVFADKIALQTELRQANANNDRTDQPIAYKVNPFAKDAT